MKDTNITIRINPSIKEQWQQVAEDNNTSLSALIVTAVTRHITELTTDTEKLDRGAMGIARLILSAIESQYSEFKKLN
ncbi:hypothetical protein [Nostoc sp. UHCC 0251]|uniref:hypothetical protein n=1 Tax=Nostoc sp. UHCC 0251 TaxID=3110240 RepID=UPI002B20B5B2|nr:hypothetical protein [Nostoc sp. UHCC 0251]MEA5625300.1 hypothetical protein [Nostoc sp. UHCC 0251]